MPETERSPDLIRFAKKRKKKKMIYLATWFLEGYWLLKVETDMSPEIKPIGRRLDFKFPDGVVRQRQRGPAM